MVAFPKYDPLGKTTSLEEGRFIGRSGSHDNLSMDGKFRFWARAATIVFSIQAFLFIVMATAGFIVFYPKDAIAEKTDFSLVLLRT